MTLTSREDMAESQEVNAIEKNLVTGLETGGAEDDSIDTNNEVTGWRLLVLHVALCLCTFLVGLVSSASRPRDTAKTKEGLHTYCHCCANHYLSIQLHWGCWMVWRSLLPRIASSLP